MKWMSRVLLIALIAWSAMAAGVEGISSSNNQIMVSGMSHSAAQMSLDAPATRDLRNGNFALACQDENGEYIANMLNYIYSPVISVPAGNSVFFDFYIRGNFSDSDEFPQVDYWGCEVTPDGGTTWYAISNPFGDPNGSNYVYTDAPGEWSPLVASYTVDGILDGYAGYDLQFRWYLQSDEDTPIGEGIFIDDVALTVDGVVEFFDDFEDGNSDGWVSEDGTATPAWWHQTTVGAYAGQSWAMNDPSLGNAGGYLDHWYQVLDSPPLTLPTDQTNTITFMQNRNIESLGTSGSYNGWDGTNIRISNDGGASWTVLTDVSPVYNSTSMYSFGSEFNEGPGVPGWGASSNGWQAVTVTIPASYQNQEVIIRWAFASDPSYNTNDQMDMFGWIVDDIDIAGVVTNDGETAEGWTAASNVPIAGDLWHIAFVGALPVPTAMTAEAGDSQVDLSWGAPISGDTEDQSYDNPAAWRYFLNDSQPYGVVFEATQDNSYLGAAHFFMLALGAPFSGTLDAQVYAVGDDNLPTDLIYERTGIVAQDYPSPTVVDLSGSGLVFNTGEKFALAVGNFTGGDQGVLCDSLSVENPASGNSVVFGQGAWSEITAAYPDIANLAIRAQFIYPDPTFTPESYNLYRRAHGFSFGDPLVSELDATSYLDADVTNGEMYYYVVTANYPNGESPFSDEVMAAPESQSVITMAHDDGTSETGFNIGSGSYQAVRFDPPGYPTLLKRVKVYSDDASVGHIVAYIWDDNGSNQMPNSEHKVFGWSYLQPGWNVYDVSEDSIWITGGDFYFGLKELSSTPAIGADTDAYSGNSYYATVDGEGNLLWDNMSSLSLNYNLMLRVDVDTAFVQVGIDDITGTQLPTDYELKQNYPNPFNPTTEISYSIPVAGHVDMRVYDLNGREVDVVVQEFQNAGTYKLQLDGSHMDSGIYIYTLRSGGVHLTEKMILLK